MSKTKIAFLIDTIETDAAGTQRQLLETIRRLDKSRFCPELVCLRESEWMKNNPLPCDVSIIGFRGFMKPDCLRMCRRFGRLIDSKGFHIVQTFFEDSIFFAYFSSYFAKTRPKYISSRRDIGLGAANRPWYHRIYGGILPLVNRRFDYIVANSEMVKQFACRREKLSSEKVKVLYNGVEIPNGLVRPKPDIFHRYPESTIWICVAASLTAVKRHDLIVRAMSQIARRSPQLPIRLAFLGAGPEHNAIAGLAQELGVLDRIEFVGVVGNVAAYLQHCDIGVLCSDREGLSNAILEYMAHKLPVVATQTGGNSELVTNETGQCVPVGDTTAIANAVLSLASDPVKRRSLGLAGYRRVAAEFSWPAAMDASQAFYESIVEVDRNVG
jgi:glycosyltransferase involved in cell wall biosynthesis